MAKPADGTYPVFFKRYVDHVKEEELAAAIETQLSIVDHFFSGIPTQKHNYAYAPGKWTLKEMLQHIVDTERIFNYRALCIARNEQQPLPGFDEDAYAANSDAANREWSQLVDELQQVRKSSNILFSSFPGNALQNVGICNNKEVSVEAIGFIMVGHLYHHISIIKERYL